jgi:hypothetical protein
VVRPPLIFFLHKRILSQQHRINQNRTGGIFMPKNIKIGHVILEDIQTPTDVKIVSEANDRVVAEACLQEAEEENRNGRCYLTEDLTREQQCKRTKELLAAGYMLGEAGHPTDTSIIRQQTIDPANTAVRYLKYWMDGPKWMAHYQGTYNAVGEAVDKDLRHGFKPAFSMRALGSLENINGRNVVRDLKYITHDFVIYPSHPGAYTTGVVSESASAYKSEFKTIFNSPERKGLYTRKSSITPIYNEQVISYIKAESANVRSVLEQFDTLYESIQLIGNNVSLRTKEGDTFVVNLESYIQNEIFSFCENRSEQLLNKRIDDELRGL